MALDIQEKRPKGVDLRERGRDEAGRTLYLDARLYMQLQVFTGCHDMDPIIRICRRSGLCGALYADVLDPYGFGLLALSTDAEYFVTELRILFGMASFATLNRKPEHTLFGRTYAIGYESDLEEVPAQAPAAPCSQPCMAMGALVPVASHRFV